MRRAFQWMLILLAAVAVATASAQQAGRVEFAQGSATIERAGATLPARAGEAVMRTDSIVTGADGYVQLRMADDASVSMRPSTRLVIDDYRYDVADPSAGAATLRLVGGILRTFTGEISRLRHDRFVVKTKIANVGVRGSGNIVAHSEETGTLNHTLTGAHVVESLDPAFAGRALVSYPGQTIQVLPGQPPRFVPTPRFLLAAVTPRPAGGKSDDKAADAAVAAGESTEPGGGGTTASTAVATAVAQSAVVAGGTVLNAAAQSAGRESVFRAFLPLGSGYQGLLGQTNYDGTSTLIVQPNGELVAVGNGLIGTFLAQGAPPPGYNSAQYSAAQITFSGGTLRDLFVSPDGAVVLGRREGGTIAVSSPDGNTTFDLGPRSVVWSADRLTPVATWSAFTGTVQYNLAASVAPTDAAGHVGTMTSATTTINFGNSTVAGSFGLSINGQAITVAGTGPVDRSSPIFAWTISNFAALGGTGSVTCTGSNCASAYQAIFNGELVGARGDWVTYVFRINPARVSGQPYVDAIVGGIALQATTTPATRIAMGTAGSAATDARAGLATTSLVASQLASLARGRFSAIAARR